MRVLLWIIIAFSAVYLLSPRKKRVAMKKTAAEFWKLLGLAIIIFLIIEILLYFTDFHL